ncbi:pyruvate ferredoxin oxidoreductase [Candidatus Bathyarchaeota archaeon]|nr:pyruvate ferredoxin oxidoreductase [Candidatus Bathyarchaeota archaeon]
MNQKLLGLNGDEAAAYAIKQVNPEVVAAYPITPQTIIVERFSEYVANGLVDSEFVAVESEHSALSACVGASATGARAYTATAANGLALMWEILYIASGMRQPIIMSIANRALSGPLNIHNDHSDSMGARDSGWIQIYCENCQEVYDSHITAWRIAENINVQLPIMICFDGFTISHTMENVFTLNDEIVQNFIGKRVFPKITGHLGETDLRLNPTCPITMGAMDLQDYYFEHKVQQHEALLNSLEVIESVENEFSEITGREYGLIQSYMMEDADVALIGMGSVMGTTKYVVDQLRSNGIKVGLIKIRCYRPFPKEKLVKAISNCKVIGIIEKSLSFGSVGSPLYQDIKTVLYDYEKKPLIIGYVHGLGGRDTSPENLKQIFQDLLKIDNLTKKIGNQQYIGLRE